LLSAVADVAAAAAVNAQLQRYPSVTGISLRRGRTSNHCSVTVIVGRYRQQGAVNGKQLQFMRERELEQFLSRLRAHVAAHAPRFVIRIKSSRACIRCRPLATATLH
jgi:translation elongation factor EF-Ts